MKKFNFSLLALAFSITLTAHCGEGDCNLESMKTFHPTIQESIEQEKGAVGLDLSSDCKIENGEVEECDVTFEVTDLVYAGNYSEAQEDETCESGYRTAAFDAYEPYGDLSYTLTYTLVDVDENCPQCDDAGPQYTSVNTNAYDDNPAEPDLRNGRWCECCELA